MRFARESRKLGGVQPFSAGDEQADEPSEPGEEQAEPSGEVGWRYARMGCWILTVLAAVALGVLWLMGRPGAHRSPAPDVSSGGSVCERARRCCIETLEKRVGLKGPAGAAKAARACRAYARAGLPDESCELGLATFQKSAAALGIACR